MAMRGSFLHLADFARTGSASSHPLVRPVGQAFGLSRRPVGRPLVSRHRSCGAAPPLSLPRETSPRAILRGAAMAFTGAPPLGTLTRAAAGSRQEAPSCP